MKNLLFPLLVFTLLLSNANLVAQSPSKDPHHFDYWLEKIRDPGQNFNQLVDEFDAFWAGREGQKGSGYKQFRRWQYNWQGEVGPDGRLHSAEYIQNEVDKFDMLAPDAVVGDWSFVGYSANPVPEAAGHGRLACIAFHPTNPDVIYVGAPAGGLWKSTTGGNNWTVCGTDQMATLGVASIAIDPSNPNTIYIGTGDQDGWDALGEGVYKSTDGGISWIQMNTGMGDVTVTRLLISSESPNMLIAATSEGVYKSYNSGASWSKTSGISGLVRDMCFKPGTFETVYACVEGHFFRSDTYGSIWEEIFFSGGAHRSVIGVSPANPAKVHFFCTRDGEAYKHFISNDSGQTFPTTMTPDFTCGQGGYNLDIAVDPANANIIYVGMVSVYKTVNGGSSWTEITNSPLHADNHALEWSPHNGRLYIANDGGIYYTANGGSTFTDINQGLAIGMTARLNISFQNPDILVCGQQDCGTLVTSGSSYYHVNGGDGMDCQIDPTNSNIIYTSFQHGPIKRTTEGPVQGASYYNIAGFGGINGITDTCGPWIMPFQLHEDNPSIMYTGFQNVWKSTNVNTSNPANVSWTRLSNFNDSKVVEMISKSPVNDNIIWAGRARPWSLHLTINANSPTPLWTEIPMPYTGSILWIETHPEDANTCYICINELIYKTTNLGSTWTRIDQGMPFISKYCIVCQAGSNEHLYVATKSGIYYRDADMPANTWKRFKTGLPLNVPVFHLDINYGTDPPTLFAGTWGRGIWKTEISAIYKPNLYFTSGTATVNKTYVTVNLGVANAQGDVSSDPCVLGYYLSIDNLITPADWLIGTDNIPELFPGIITGQSIQLDVEYALNPPPPGTYFLGAYVDKDFIISETNETDNSFLFPQTVTINTPGIAQNIIATDGDFGDRISIDWDPVPGATDTVYYRVYRNTSNNSGTAQQLGIVWNTNTAYTDFTAEDGIDYYYWVKASHNFLGVNPGSFSAPDAGWQYLKPPTNVQATDGEYNDHIKISWDPPENGTYFKVWRNTTSDPNTAIPLSSNWSTLTYFNDYAVSSAVSYFYWVKSARSSTGLKASPNFSSYDAGWAAFLNAPTASASDGTSTDDIHITWNTIPGATHYKLHQSYTNDPLTATPITAWVTSTSFDHIAQRGVYSYYWVQAATSVVGTMATGLGQGDSGWRRLETVQNVQATDGQSTEHIQITWNNQPYASQYRIYRSLNPLFSVASPVSDWITATSFLDNTASAPPDYYYWVLCANNPEIPSSEGTHNVGWRKLSSTTVEATQGMYFNKIRVTWDPVPGANSYRIYKSEYAWITDTITAWSSSLNYQYDDYEVTQGIQYRYWVQAAYNNYGTKPGDLSSFAWGFADECGNFADDPAYHIKSFHGVTIELSHRVLNNGMFPLPNPSRILYFLVDDPFTGGWDYVLGQKQIPALPAGGYQNVSFISKIDTITGGPVPYGTYYLGYYLDIGMDNCETNVMDNYIVWSTQPLNYTDALHGTYTVGGTDPDYPDLNSVATDLENKGISDPVTFNIRPGFYNEQLYLQAVSGSSATHPIVFQTEPSKGDTAEISFAGYEENYTVMLNGATHIILRNLKLSSPGYTNYHGTYGRVIEIKNNASDITIENCRIKGCSDLTYITEESAAIYCGNSKCQNITIKNNLIQNGSWGIYLSSTGPGSNATQGTVIEMNDLRDFSYTGIYLSYQINPIIKKNHLYYSSTPVSQSFGMNLEGTEGGLSVEQNQIIMEPSSSATFGLTLYYINNATVRGKVANNFISIISDGSPLYGIVHFASQKTDVLYNSINISGTTCQGCHAISLDCDNETGITYDNQVLNNIFANQAGGYSIGIGDNAIAYNYLSFCDYNDLFVNGAYLGYYGAGNTIADLSSWVAATPFDDNSVSANPGFISYSDLHTSSMNINGLATALPEVVIDFDGEVRDYQHPDIGADEYIIPPADLDASLVDIISPMSGFGLSDQEPVSVEIANFGTIGLGSLTVNYTIDGGVPVTEVFADTLEPFGGYGYYTFATKADLSAAGSYEITAYTSLPGDENPSNDTVTVTVENQPINPYNCIPLYGEGCTYGASIDIFYFANLSHEYTGCSPNGYGEFTELSADITQGEYSWLGFSSQSDLMYLALWIDFNDDLIFAENEKLKDSLYCPWAYLQTWDTINIPVGAIPGQHLMRARAVKNLNTIDPCGYYEYGEAHDYKVTVHTGGGLSVNAGSDVSSCRGQTTTLTAIATGGTPPYTYAWSNGMTGPSITVSMDTTTVFAVQAIDQSGYTAIDDVTVTLFESPESLPSANSPVCEGSDILLQGLGMAFGLVAIECQSNCSLPPGYCSSFALDTMGTEIDEVVFNTIHNNTAGSCAKYSDFTGISTSVGRNYSYQLSVTSGTCDWDQYKAVSVFIDWNRDGDFDDSGEVVADFDPTFSTVTQDTIVQVPAGAVLGETLMRVVAVGEWVELDTILPCGSYWSGEAEDYTVNIVDLVPNQIVSYEWNGPSGFYSTQQNPVIPEGTVFNTGSYVLTVTDNNGCNDSDTIEVVVQPLPYAYAGSDSLVCSDQVFQLSADAGYYSSLLWSTSGTGSFNANTILDPFYYPSPADLLAGNVILTLKAYAVSPCLNYAESSMTLSLQSPPYAWAGNTDTICENENFILSEAIATQYSSLLWTTSGTGNFDHPSILHPTYYPGPEDIANGEVYLTLTANALSPCQNSSVSVLILEIQALPTAYAGEDTTLCSNEIYSTGSATAGGYASLYWTTSGTGSFSNPAILHTTYTPSQQDLSAGSVILTLTANSVAPCTDVTTASLVLGFTPGPAVFAGNQAVICENEYYSLTESSASNYSSLLWVTSGTGYFDDPYALHPLYYPGTGDTGEFILGLWAFGNSPCEDAYSNLLLYIQASPSAFAGPDAVINAGETYTLTGASAAEYSSLLWTTTGTGYFDDPHILHPTYYPATGETGISLLTLTAYGFSPCGNATDDMNLEIVQGGFDLNVHVFLEGPFEGAGMYTSLNSWLPLSQPYNVAPWYYSGTESVSSIPNLDVVDWVLVELRDAPAASQATPATSIAMQAAFILDNGSIVDVDGSSMLHFMVTINYNLFVVVWQRNHLAVMSALPLTENAGIYSWDFSSGAGQAYGGTNAHKQLAPGVWGMIGGDGNANGQISNADKVDVWKVQAGSSGYLMGDFDMNVQVNNADKIDVWKVNSGAGSQVPD
jgi:photosystem II stability/assembly factor-like uncharacterized protein/fibronectin type 3 domain-containing protein